MNTDYVGVRIDTSLSFGHRNLRLPRFRSKRPPLFLSIVLTVLIHTGRPL